MMRKEGEGEGSACPYSTGGKAKPEGISMAHLLPGGHREHTQDLFLVWAHPKSSADLGQAQLISSGAHSHICSLRV